MVFVPCVNLEQDLIIGLQLIDHPSEKDKMAIYMSKKLNFKSLCRDLRHFSVFKRQNDK